MIETTPSHPDPQPVWAARSHDRSVAQDPVIAIPAPQETAYAHLGWPKALHLGEDQVLLALLAGQSHLSGGCPAFAKSNDRGASFAPPTVLRTLEDGYSNSGNLAIGTAADGAIILLSMAYHKDTRNTIYGWRSEDGATTWRSVDTSALGPNKTGSVFGRIMRMDNGDLMAVGHYRKGSQPRETGIWQSFSRDGGMSWEPAVCILDTELFQVEPCLTRLAGGRLLIHARNDSRTETKPQGSQTALSSIDDGRSWQNHGFVLHARNTDTHRLAAPFIMPDPDHPGGVIALTVERSMNYRPPGSLELWRADGEMLQYRHVCRLLDFPHIENDPHTDFGYPWMVPLSNGSWRLFYYHGQRNAGPSHIWRTDLQIPG